MTIVKVKPTTLQENVLNKVWWTWLEGERTRLGKLTKDEEYVLSRRLAYGYFNRRGRKAERFEQWLFINGAEVRKSAGRFHLEFVEEANASMFALKYA